jgi:hypothetical protein
MRRWARVLAAYSPGIGLTVAGAVVLLTLTTTTTVYSQCALPSSGPANCGPPLTQYLINPAVPALWIASALYFVWMTILLFTRGRWLITNTTPPKTEHAA